MNVQLHPQVCMWPKILAMSLILLFGILGYLAIACNKRPNVQDLKINQLFHPHTHAWQMVLQSAPTCQLRKELLKLWYTIIQRTRQRFQNSDKIGQIHHFDTRVNKDQLSGSELYITWTQQNYSKTPRRLSLNINDTTMIWLQEGKGKFHSFQKCYLFLFVKSVGNISSTFSFWQFILYSGLSFFGKRRQFNR